MSNIRVVKVKDFFLCGCGRLTKPFRFVLEFENECYCAICGLALIDIHCLKSFRNYKGVVVKK